MGMSISANRGPAAVAAGLALVGLAASTPTASAYTPQSREVRQAVDRAVGFLEQNVTTDPRPGAVALIGIVLLKEGKHPSHPGIVRAANYLSQKALAHDDSTKLGLDIYSTSLMIVFFSLFDPNRYSVEVETLLAYLESKQKGHGGWGYDDSIRKTGDTSMTQNAVLSFWEATRAGFRVSPTMIDRGMIWLLKTQDPSGGFGYQGNLSNDFTLVQQTMIKPSMATAGLGSLYICAELLNVGKAPKKREEDGRPQALREKKREAAPAKSQVNPDLVHRALERGKGWVQANYTITQRDYNLYYLYTLERYFSFREMAEARAEQQPRWYDDGVRYLLENQADDGSWTDQCGKVSATAFGVLFLIRSTRKSIEQQQTLGDGTLVGGRGLPKFTAGLTIRGGQVISKLELGSLDQVLDSLGETESLDYDAALSALEELPSEKLEPLVAKHARKLQELAGDPSPKARLAAVRALGRQRNLDNVPVLIYALTDPDPVIVREARDALRRLSRKLDGFGLPDDPTETQRTAAIRKWQAWYRAIRPDAVFED